MQKSVVKAALAGIFCLFCANVASANVEDGTMELSLSGSYRNQSLEYRGIDFDMTVASCVLTFNYYLSETVSVGGNLRASLTSPKWGSDRVDLQFLGRTDYYLTRFVSTPGLSPYVGARLGLASLEAVNQSDTAFAYGVQTGVKKFLSENISLNFEINVLMWSGGIFSMTDTSLDIGLSYYY